MTACSRQYCDAPETSCDLGHLDPTKCPAWSGSSDRTNAAVVSEELGLPWSGHALGLNDVHYVTGRAKPIVIGVIGPQNAGKTTLLGAWYLLVGRGLSNTSKRRFAGSYSLAGWEFVAHALRWTAGWSPENQPRFPPHTTSREARIPGLLHLSFRCGEERPQDYLFADAPGEWFQRWAVNRDAPEAEGARWIARHSDAFLLIADREALAGSNKGSARGALQVLSQRLAAERGDRPVALVWTKADVAIEPQMESSIREAVKTTMPDAVEFSVAVGSRGGTEEDIVTALSKLFNWVLSIRRPLIKLPDAEAKSDDFFFRFNRS